MQSGQKSAALLFHDMAEMLIFKGRRLGHFSVKKKGKRSHSFKYSWSLSVQMWETGRDDQQPVCGIQQQGQRASGMSIMQHPLLSLQVSATGTARGTRDATQAVAWLRVVFAHRAELPLTISLSQNTENGWIAPPIFAQKSGRGA